MLADHQVTTPRVSLEPRACENCRRLFHGKQTSTTVFCNPCRNMYLEDAGQLWRCIECSTERKYGDQQPDETKGKFLRCFHCSTVTEHAFSRMSPRMQA